MMIIEKIASKAIEKGLLSLAKKLLGKKGNDVLNKVTDFLGLDSPDDVLASLDDPEIVEELHSFQLRIAEIDLDNLKSARDLRKTSDYADKLSDEIIKKNVLYILILAILNALLIFLSKKMNIEPAVVVALANIFGMIIQSLLQERKDVTGFWLGSSIGSKLKDEKKEG